MKKKTDREYKTEKVNAGTHEVRVLGLCHHASSRQELWGLINVRLSTKPACSLHSIRFFGRGVFKSSVGLPDQEIPHGWGMLGDGESSLGRRDVDSKLRNRCFDRLLTYMYHNVCTHA